MTTPINYLESAHQTIAWFNDRFADETLDMHPPFQRNPVWTDPQKSYLIDTVLRSLPIPELYMQTLVDENGKQKHIVVDGQQRLRACLDFITGKFRLNEPDSPEWRQSNFDDLSGDQKKQFFGYKFVVRTLPELDEKALREIFERLNRNVVALNPQELRHATYWGPFIKLVEAEAEGDSFWAASGVFTATDFRRMLDVEFISELVVSYLHGFQDKKHKLDHFYQLYEQNFEDAKRVSEVLRKVTAEIPVLVPDLKTTRWSKKSDFYTLFLVVAAHAKELPFASDIRGHVATALEDFSEAVDRAVRLEGQAEEEELDADVLKYARAVIGAASDVQRRRDRDEALAKVIGEAIAKSAAKGS